MASFAEKRAAFQNRIKVNQSSSQQSKAAKQGQFSSSNKKSSSNSNKAGAPDRQRSKTTGRGNER